MGNPVDISTPSLRLSSPQGILAVFGAFIVIVSLHLLASLVFVGFY
jgi:hypothetical protein